MELLNKLKFYSQKHKDKLAFVTNNQKLTYKELWDFSQNLGSWFKKNITDDKKPIVVVGHKDPLMVVSFLASIKSGHAYVPCDHFMPLDRIQKIIEATATECVINLSALKIAPSSNNIVIEKSQHEISLEKIIQEQHGELAASSAIGLDDDFYLMFTSGTTGMPKGVRITTGCITDFMDWMSDEFKFKEGEESFLNQVPLSFDISDFELFNSLNHAGTVYSITDEHIKNPHNLFKRLYEIPITFWVSTPSFVNMCLREKTFNSKNISTLNRFFFAGEVLSNKCVKEVLDRFPNSHVFNLYGPTEATCVVTCIEIDKNVLENFDPLPIGYAKPRSEILIMKDGKKLPDNEKGEIVLVGSNVSPGYLNNPEQTSKKFFKQELEGVGLVNGYYTGDQGYKVDGLVFYDGRMDNQVQLHGYRIELDDIENNIRRISGVDDIVVLPHIKNGEIDYLIGFVLWNGKKFKGDLEWIVYLNNKLKKIIPNYMIPKKLIKKDNFPMTMNGKVDKKQLTAEIMK